MRKFLKPRIVVSACLNLKPVRYDGKYIKNDFVLNLKKYCEFTEVCPEVEIGLPVPRGKVIVYKKGGKYRLFQPSTGMELTDKMEDFSKKFLNSLEEIDGFLLKSKSPSCGVSGTFIYENPDDRRYYSKGKGIFALKVIEKFPLLPIEDENRLKNEWIKKNFLIQIFALADLRRLIKNAKKIEEIMEFHERYKYLLMASSEKRLKEMEKLMSFYKKGENLKEIVNKYRQLFLIALKKSRRKDIINHMHLNLYPEEIS